MTWKNSKQTLPVIFTITALLIAIPGIAYANTEPWTWPSADQHYLCTSSVPNITHTSNVNPCGDLNSSSNVWEAGSGNSWDLDPSSSGWPVYAWSLPSGTGGETYVAYNSSGEARYAWIVMNKNLSWEDSNKDWWTSGYDWRTFTGHEFGHLAGISHTSNSNSIMYDSRGPNDAERSPPQHEINHMKDKY